MKSANVVDNNVQSKIVIADVQRQIISVYWMLYETIFSRYLYVMEPERSSPRILFLFSSSYIRMCNASMSESHSFIASDCSLIERSRAAI